MASDFLPKADIYLPCLFAALFFAAHRRFIRSDNFFRPAGVCSTSCLRWTPSRLRLRIGLWLSSGLAAASLAATANLLLNIGDFLVDALMGTTPYLL